MCRHWRPLDAACDISGHDAGGDLARAAGLESDQRRRKWGRDVGGIGVALRIARMRDIPAVNLALLFPREVCELLRNIQRRTRFS